MGHRLEAVCHGSQPVSLVCPFLPILSVEIFSILGEIGDKSVENFSQNLSLADIGRKFWSEVKKSLISVEIALNAFEIKKIKYLIN